jgi:transcriptional regulator with XRE-family HTH domain
VRPLRKPPVSRTSHRAGISARVRRGDAAAEDVRRQIARLAAELRDARLEAGLGIADVARAAGMSPTQLGRLECGMLRAPTVEQLGRAWAPLGMRLSIRPYPIGSPIRDRAQLALFRRVEACLGLPLRLRREVPLQIEGDRRAWDGMIEGDGAPFFVEGESNIRDLQAVERKLRLRLRDDSRASLVLLVATRSDHNRMVINEYRETIRDLLPLDGGPILRALRSGHRPAASGIVLI